MAGESYQAGRARIEVDQSALRLQLDRVSDGAASEFIAATTAVLERVRGGAVARWPVRTGRSRDGFEIRSVIGESAITVDLLNTARSKRYGRYAYKIRWSVRTETSLDDEARIAASKGGDPAAQERIRVFFRRRLTRQHGQGAPSTQLAGRQPWAVLVRAPVRKETPALITRLRAGLARLAERA